MYERAARLMPHNDDVRHNLEFVRERTVDRIPTPPRLFVWTWVDGIRDLLPLATVATSALVVAILLSLSVALTINLRSKSSWAVARNMSWTLAALFVINLGLVGLRAQADSADSAAIIMEDKIEVRSAPDHTSKEVFALHEGTKVVIVQQLEGWAEIRLADDRQGWVPLSAFEII